LSVNKLSVKRLVGQTACRQFLSVKRLSVKRPVGQTACRSNGLSVKRLSVEWLSVKWLSVKRLWPSINYYIGNVDTRVKQRSRDTKRSSLMRRLVFWSNWLVEVGAVFPTMKTQWKATIKRPIMTNPAQRTKKCLSPGHLSQF
jgi:hypothetical protein